MVAVDHRSALGYYRAYLLEPIAVFYVAADLLRDQVWRQRFLAALAVGGVVVALANLANFALTPGHPVGIGTVPVAIFNSPNFVAMFLEPLLALSLGVALFSPSPTSRWVGAVLSVVFLAALLMTFSRGGYLALAALALLALLSVPRRFWLILAPAALLGLAALRLPAVGGRVIEFLNAKDPANTNFTYRLKLWRATLEMLGQHPLFGAGLNASYAHNLWLTFWSQLGLVGVLTFTVLLVALIIRSWRALPAAPAIDRPLIWGLGAAFLLLAVHGLVDTPYWKNDLSVEFWVLAALLVAAMPAAARPTAPT